MLLLMENNIRESQVMMIMILISLIIFLKESQVMMIIILISQIIFLKISFKNSKWLHNEMYIILLSNWIALLIKCLIWWKKLSDKTSSSQKKLIFPLSVWRWLIQWQLLYKIVNFILRNQIFQWLKVSNQEHQFQNSKLSTKFQYHKN